MGRWAPATPASRKWDGRVAWCARGVTAGALAGAAKEDLPNCHVAWSGTIAFGQVGGAGTRLAPMGCFSLMDFVMLRAVGARHLGGCGVWGHRRRSGRCGAQSDSGGGPYNSWGNQPVSRPCADGAAAVNW